MNKKGALPWWLNLMIAAAIFLVIWLIISGKIFSGFSGETTARLVEQRLEACKAKGEKGQLDGTSWPDKDSDGLPDNCDNCPNTPNFGPGVEDKDGDLFPFVEDKVCCGNNGKGEDDPKLKENEEKYCETETNDLEYGPNKLITSYLNIFKSKKG